MVIAGNCHFLAGSRGNFAEATGAEVEHGSEWKSEELEYACWGQDEEPQTVRSEHKDEEYFIPSLSVMGSLLTRETDTMCPMRFRMNKADKALRSTVAHRTQE